MFKMFLQLFLIADENTFLQILKSSFSFLQNEPISTFKQSYSNGLKWSQAMTLNANLAKATSI